MKTDWWVLSCSLDNLVIERLFINLWVATCKVGGFQDKLKFLSDFILPSLFCPKFCALSGRSLRILWQLIACSECSRLLIVSRFDFHAGDYMGKDGGGKEAGTFQRKLSSIASGRAPQLSSALWILCALVHVWLLVHLSGCDRRALTFEIGIFNNKQIRHSLATKCPNIWVSSFPVISSP